MSTSIGLKLHEKVVVQVNEMCNENREENNFWRPAEELLGFHVDSEYEEDDEVV
jgi:hypothetical protein